MYVHCHNCKWQQDDFYSIDGYNPANFLKSFNEVLCGKNIDVVQKCHEFVNNTPIHPELTQRENIARWYEYFANNIRNMKWITVDAFYNDSNKSCPECGSDELDMD
jgi:hypothetical protein